MNPGNLDQDVRVDTAIKTRTSAGVTEDVVPGQIVYCCVKEVSASIAMGWAQRNVTVTHQVIFRRDDAHIVFNSSRLVWTNNGNVVLKPIGQTMSWGNTKAPLSSIMVEQLQQVVE